MKKSLLLVLLFLIFMPSLSFSDDVFPWEIFIPIFTMNSYNGCSEVSDCGGNQYCQKAPGDCVGEGLCSIRPDICPEIYDPVCGCDGSTYGNSCEASAAGININYKGECRPTVCSGASDCDAKQYCQKAPGDCDGEGLCTIRPDICFDIWSPVCGCDGSTYGNSCYAAAAGVNINYEGECRPTLCDDGSELVCLMIPPVCQEYEMLAIQNGCWVCVNPQTCLPWGVPECRDDFDCPIGEVCDFCGTSSCPYCEDCVPSCVTATGQ